MSGAQATMFFFASIFMQQADGYSPIKAGLADVPLAVCVVAGAGIASTLITKIAARPVLIAGLVLTTTGLVLLWRSPAGGSYPTGLLPFLALGLGAGLCYVTLQIAAFAGISDQEAGIGAGLINTSQEAGGALGLAVITTIAYNGLAAKLAAAGGRPVLIRAAQASAGHEAFLAAACFSFAALLLAAFLMPRVSAADKTITTDHTAEPLPASDQPDQARLQ